MDRQPITNVFELTVFEDGKGAAEKFVWQVGREYRVDKERKGICSSIKHDTNSYYFNGQARWTVYVRVPGNPEEQAHVHYENCRVKIKCTIPEII